MLKLKELRISEGLSQAGIAKKFGLLQQTYARYESEETQAPFDILLDIANYYCVSLDYLFGRTDEKRINTGQRISPEETRLLTAFNALVPPMKDFVLNIVENAAESQKKNKKEINYEI